MKIQQYIVKSKEVEEDLPEGFRGGSKEKVEKEDKVRRKTTQEDIQLELDLTFTGSWKLEVGSIGTSSKNKISIRYPVSSWLSGILYPISDIDVH